MKKILGVLAVVVMIGCVSAEDKQAIKNGADVGQGNLREWDQLTPAQQKQAHFNLTGNFVVLDHNINGTAIPANFTEFAAAAAAVGSK